jgi:hypothetical protein
MTRGFKGSNEVKKKLEDDDDADDENTESRTRSTYMPRAGSRDAFKKH